MTSERYRKYFQWAAGAALLLRVWLTRDKKNLVIESYVAWKIDDPKRFVETVSDPVAAEMRLHDIVWSGLSAALGTQDLESIVSTNLQT